MHSEKERYVREKQNIIGEVFGGLEEAAAKRNEEFGVSHLLASVLVQAVEQLQEAVEGNNPRLAYLRSDRPALSDGTLGEAPEYFKEFWGEVGTLLDSAQSQANAAWCEHATAALTALDQGLAEYANRYRAG